MTHCCLYRIRPHKYYERFIATLKDLTNSHPPNKAAVHIALLRSEVKVPEHERLPGFQWGTQTQTNLAQRHIFAFWKKKTSHLRIYIDVIHSVKLNQLIVQDNAHICNSLLRLYCRVKVCSTCRAWVSLTDTKAPMNELYFLGAFVLSFTSI